jgi:HlyD family secretion protein
VWKLIGAALALCVLLLAGWFYVQGSRPPEVAVVPVERRTLERVVSTNGRLEPSEWTAFRSQTEGLVERVLVEKGQRVQSGQTLVILSSREARNKLAEAEARILLARAEIETLEKGGRTAERAEIVSSLTRARLELDQLRREAATVDRLVERKAATRQEAQDLRDRLERQAAHIASIEARQSALVNPPDLTAARARLRDAQAGAEAARQRINLTTISSSITGTVYQLDVRPGAYVQPGSPVASVGVVGRLKAIAYVDEPELASIRPGLPVRITWDAAPERVWESKVERVPSQISALGTRQVGETQILVANADGVLLPGTNITAAIQVKAVPGALALPKEAVRREGGLDGVFLLDGETLTFRPLRLGVSSVTHVEVLEGVKEGDRVAVAGEADVRSGMKIRPATR